VSITSLSHQFQGWGRSPIARGVRKPARRSPRSPTGLQSLISATTFLLFGLALTALLRDAPDLLKSRQFAPGARAAHDAVAGGEGSYDECGGK